MASDDAMQVIPQCPHCGSEFLEEREMEAPRQPQQPQMGGLAAMLQQMQQQMQEQMQQQMQANRYPPAPQQEGPQGPQQPQPALEAIFRSLMQMHSGTGPMGPMAFRPLAALGHLPGLFQGSDNRSFQDILDHLFQQSEHKGPPPTDKDVIASLPRRVIKAEEVQEDFECAVCQEGFEAGSQVIQLPCSHDYHDACILPWIENRNTCPTCRYEMKPQDDATATQPTSPSSSSTAAHNVGESDGSGRHGGASMQDGVYVPGGDADADMLDEAYADMLL